MHNLLAAAAQYRPMTDLPFLTSDWALGTSPSEVFDSLFMLAVTIGAMLAVVMFMWGGLQLITAADNPSKVNMGKKRMQNAVLGLLMLLSTYLILTTINPQITSLRFFQDASPLNSDTSALPDSNYIPVYTGELQNILNQRATPTGTNAAAEDEARLQAEQHTFYCRKTAYNAACSTGFYATENSCLLAEGRGNCGPQTAPVTTLTNDGPFVMINFTNQRYATQEACEVAAKLVTPPTTCTQLSN